MATEESGALRTSVTLRDVAERTGVSITTVSRILNNRAAGIPIREETRQRVIATAAELGYRPNLLARGLRGSRSSLIGVIARDISEPFHLQILRGINAAARGHEYRVFLGHVDYQPDVALSYASMFEQSHADGILIVGDLPGGEEATLALARQHRNVVGVTDRTTRLEFPGVYGDSRGGTRLALEHLWELGHREIVCAANEQTADGRLRIAVYREFLAERGLGRRARVFIAEQAPARSLETGLAMFESFETEGWPTAVFAGTDSIAVGLMQAAFRVGVRIPDQISIVGFDDIDFAAFTIPPLTTVNQSGQEMGRRAAELLHDLIERNADRAAVEDVVLPTRLVVRASTVGPVR